MCVVCLQTLQTVCRDCKQLPIRPAAPAEPVWLNIDRERIGQVVANLISNALKYSQADKPVDVTVQAEANEIVVAVRDQGPGIPLEEQKQIFNQFHRARGVEPQDGSGGLGLGLYISKAIVERYGGEIRIESAPGQGSTFSFALPLASPAA